MFRGECLAFRVYLDHDVTHGDGGVVHEGALAVHLSGPHPVAGSLNVLPLRDERHAQVGQGLGSRV